MSISFGICLIFVGITCAEKHLKSFDELREASFNAFLTCSSELQLNIETCMELLDDTLDHSDSKYDGCKCSLPCVGKIIGTMNVDDGKWNEQQFWDYTALLENPEWKAEAQVIGENCADRVNTHCSAGFPMMQCLLKHSKKLQNMKKNYMDQKQANLNAANSTNVEYEEE